MESSGAALNISAVERETGLSKDVLRIWERRYGFPHPDRDDNAERQYAADEVAKLRAIKRLMTPACGRENSSGNRSTSSICWPSNAFIRGVTRSRPPSSAT